MLAFRGTVTAAFFCSWYLAKVISQEAYRVTNDGGASIPTSDWEASMAAVVTKLENSPANTSLFPDLLPLLFPSSKPDIFQQLLDQSKRLVNISSPAFSTVVQYDAKSFLAKLVTYQAYSVNEGSGTDGVKGAEMTLSHFLSDCEYLYTKLSNIPAAAQTFVLSVPLAFLHMSALKEKLARSSADLKKNTENDIFSWIAKYWQFIHERYNSWKQWRVGQLHVEHWLQTTAIESICHASLSDKLSKRYLIKLETGNCDDPQPLLTKITPVLSAYSNDLQFEMMGIISKLFVLHKFIPGYERAGPFPGIFSATLTSGVIHPLNYQIPNSKTRGDVSYLGVEPKGQPVLTNPQLKGITNITVRQWDWLDGMLVQYENGDDRFQGNQNGAAPESLSFVPNTGQCLASIRWKMSSKKNIITSATFTSRDGRSLGTGDKIKWADLTVFTTAPLLYCISSVAVCAVQSEGAYNRPAVVAFRVAFELSNASSTIPEPMAKTLNINQGLPVSLLRKHDYIKSNGTESQTSRTAIPAISSEERTTPVTGRAFHIPDVVVIAAASMEQRSRILQSQIKPLWEKTLDGNVSNTLKISLGADNRFNPRYTPDGMELRRISYIVSGSANGNFSEREADEKFRNMAVSAKNPDIWAVPNSSGNWVFTSKYNLSTTPIYLTVNSSSTSVIPPGPFTIDNVLHPMVKIGNRTIRETMDEDVRPLWKEALGSKVTLLELFLLTLTSKSEDGNIIQQNITYQVNGITETSLDTNGVFRRFTAKAGEDALENARAVSEHYGN